MAGHLDGHPGVNMTREDELRDAMRELVVQHAAETLDDFIRDHIDATESPIERLFLIAATGMRLLEESFRIEPQVQIGRYRVDFVARLVHRHHVLAQVIVECDGHDWHERTKEQAARDKARDRWLAGQGWQILRFTGSEVHRDAHECADQVLAHLIDMAVPDPCAMVH